METLKDKWTYKDKDTSYSTDTDNECFMYQDVREALKEYEDFILTYIPAKDMCDFCHKNYCIMYRRKKFIKDDYSFCDDCLRDKIFGDFL